MESVDFWSAGLFKDVQIVKVDNCFLFDIQVGNMSKNFRLVFQLINFKNSKNTLQVEGDNIYF